jgi:hypothetical protein
MVSGFRCQGSIIGEFAIPKFYLLTPETYLLLTHKIRRIHFNKLNSYFVNYL